MGQTFTSNSPDDLQPIAEQLLRQHQAERVFAFYGEMGAGKTTFIKTLCNLLGATDNVSSPTFAIVNEYITTGSDSIYHFDLYRIKSWKELLEIGYEDYFYSGRYCFIEWPEKIVDLLPEGTVEVKIAASPDGAARIISF